MNAERFDVDAKAASAQTAEQMRLMLQRLLAERFRMKSRVEKREMSTFALRVARLDGRLGNQMKPTVVDCRPIRSPATPATPGSASPLMVRPLHHSHVWAAYSQRGRGAAAHERHDGSSVRSMAVPVRRQAGLDQTSLMGEFDIELSFNVETLAPSPAGGVGDDPPVVTAVQEQLGLRMLSTRAPVDVIVIESVERPSVN